MKCSEGYYLMNNECYECSGPSNTDCISCYNNLTVFYDEFYDSMFNTFITDFCSSIDKCSIIFLYYTY